MGSRIVEIFREIENVLTDLKMLIFGRHIEPTFKITLKMEGTFTITLKMEGTLTITLKMEGKFTNTLKKALFWQAQNQFVEASICLRQ